MFHQVSDEIASNSPPTEPNDDNVQVHEVGMCLQGDLSLHSQIFIEILKLELLVKIAKHLSEANRKCRKVSFARTQQNNASEF